MIHSRIHVGDHLTIKEEWFLKPGEDKLGALWVKTFEVMEIAGGNVTLRSLEWVGGAVGDHMLTMSYADLASHFPLQSLAELHEVALPGDHVEKVKGYPFPGIVICAGRTTAGQPRYMVESTVIPGLLHIFSPEQLALVKVA